MTTLKIFRNYVFFHSQKKKKSISKEKLWNGCGKAIKDGRKRKNAEVFLDKPTTPMTVLIAWVFTMAVI